MLISKALFTSTARQRLKEAREFGHNWRASARLDYDFVAGKQWLQDDLDVLEAEDRPTITFNYSEKMIDAVIGAEINNRYAVSFRPRSIEDAGLAELWQNAATWVRDECNAEDEESDAFRDMLITGLGWVQHRMSYDEDPDGKIIIERIDPLEMGYDPAATKPGLTDRRYGYRNWWVDEREAKLEWPDALLNAQENTDGGGSTITRGQRYDNDSEDGKDRHKDQVQITHYECVEREVYYRIADAQGLFELDEAAFKKIKKALDDSNIEYVKQYRRVYYQGFFSGDTLLEMAKSPCQVGFTFQAITGKRDHNTNTWYGLVNVMRDPQRWANKWLSQVLHIINSNAKGGLLAEINAFVDPTKAQEEWAKPDSITLLKEGSIDKVKQKQQAPYPSGLDRLMEFALGALPMVTGINLEALGLANREQAGVLEAARKQAAYGLLAPLFDSLRRYRKNGGRVLLFFIHEFISDDRLVRIGGPDSQEFLPLTKQPDAPRFDIIVDQSPDAPDVKQKTWETLMQLVPSLLKAGMPLPPDLLDYSPLPVSLSTKWKKFAAEGAQSPEVKQLQQQLQQLQQQAQQELQKLQQENTQLKLDISVDQQEVQQKGQIMSAELNLKQQLQEAEIALEQYKVQKEIELARDKMTAEMTIKRITAANKPEPKGAE